jgi:hypothetical protein
MSTINAANYGDGSSSVPASAVLSGTAKVLALYTTQTSTSLTAGVNISSLTDEASGETTLNFTNDFADTNFKVSGAAKRGGQDEGQVLYPKSQAVGSVLIKTGQGGWSVDDADRVEVLITGDLA